MRKLTSPSCLAMIRSARIRTEDVVHRDLVLGDDSEVSAGPGEQVVGLGAGALR